MLTRNYIKQTLNKRVIIFLTCSVLFIVSFVLNIVESTSAYDYDLNVVPALQRGPIMGTNAFNVFMNLVSVIFNPMICAGYIFILYLITYRKLEVIAFLIWFFFLSWLLGILKMAIQQPRPYWLPGSEVQMKSWTCFTDYGCPSGHSMLAIIILQFFLRFFARVHKWIYNYIGIFYVLILLIELLVMLSRMMLGMHTLNQVLFGMSIGLFSFIPYYLFVQSSIMSLLLKIFIQNKSMKVNIGAAIAAGVFIAIEILLAFLPTYNTAEYFAIISATNGCSKVKEFQCFQYNCLVGTSIIMAGFGIIIGLNYMDKPQNLIKQFSYSRLSVKFLLRLVIMIVLGAIPLVIFVNPLWAKINIRSNAGAALLQWGLSNIAFFLATFLILLFTPIIGDKFGYETYNHPKSYAQFKQYESFDLLKINENNQFIQQKSRRETELITTINSEYSKQA